MVDEAAQASGVNLRSLVDDVIYDPAGSYFTMINGKRPVNHGSSQLGMGMEAGAVV
jgi:hypothetical protein